MHTVDTVEALRTQVTAWHQQQLTVAFVPTMGNLHQGHLSLVAKAKKLADKVVASIFVNPLQFDDKNDLAAYPQTLAEDKKQLTLIGCDLLFTPTAELMYPQGMTEQTLITVPNMDDKLCGKGRPGHFNGVATVVAKLFNMVQADIAVFGEKDYQQLMLIKAMVNDLNFVVEIIGVPTCREDSGLAMSSRNQNLTEQQKQQAVGLYQTLLTVQKQLEQGDHDFLGLQQQALATLTELGFEPEYVDIRHTSTLEQAKSTDKSLRILAAARLGRVRLIDNIACYLD